MATRSPIELCAANEAIRALFSTPGPDCPNAEVQKHDDCLLISSSVPFSLYNGIFCSRFSDENVKSRVRETVSVLREKQTPGVFWVGPANTPTSLEEELVLQGCTKTGTQTDIAFDIAKVRVPPGVRFFLKPVELEKVQNLPDLNAWSEVFFANFKFPEFAKDYFVNLQGHLCLRPDSEVQNFFIRRKGERVGTVSLIGHEDVLGVYCVSMNPGHRGFGLATSMMLAVYEWIQETKRYAYAVGSANEAGFRVYSKGPFVTLGKTHLYKI